MAPLLLIASLCIVSARVMAPLLLIARFRRYPWYWVLVVPTRSQGLRFGNVTVNDHQEVAE